MRYGGDYYGHQAAAHQEHEDRKGERESEIDRKAEEFRKRIAAGDKDALGKVWEMALNDADLCVTFDSALSAAAKDERRTDAHWAVVAVIEHVGRALAEKELAA